MAASARGASSLSVILPSCSAWAGKSELEASTGFVEVVRQSGCSDLSDSERFLLRLGAVPTAARALAREDLLCGFRSVTAVAQGW